METLLRVVILLMKILVADDHAIVRKGFQQIVATVPGWRIAAEASSSEEVLTALRADRFDIVVLDVTLGRRSAIDLLAQIRAQYPALPVLILSMHPEQQYAVRCLRLGANGYIQKDSAPEEILEAMARVAGGSKYISPSLAGMLAEDAVYGTERPHDRLSSREFEVFRLIASGRSVTEIADILNLSVKTISTYRARILEKTGFHSNADIITYAIRNSLV